MFKETKTRSIAKSILWRLIATLNSFTILAIAFTEDPLENAICMNITGLLVYYLYERLWNKIKWGKNNTERIDDE